MGRAGGRGNARTHPHGSRDLKEARGKPCGGLGGRMFQAEGSASAGALRRSMLGM